MDHEVTVFKSYPVKEGQKIRIEDSPLEGDWEIIGVTPYKLTLRCPVTKKELVKDRFCFFTREQQDQWPKE